jgi:hypothetical protein
MAKHLTVRDIGILVSLIDAWEGKLGWEALCDAVAPLIGARPTRQTLNSHEEVKTAFNSKKALLKKPIADLKRPASLNIAEQRIRRLESELARLRIENEVLLERFVRWQYNAYKHGLKKFQLDAELPKIDRLA